jgi:hypothetical protein
MDDDAAVVRGVLGAAGVQPPEADVAALVQSYAMTRQMVGLLYTVQEAREEWPALRFRADPPTD